MFVQEEDAQIEGTNGQVFPIEIFHFGLHFCKWLLIRMNTYSQKLYQPRRLLT
jgi:hypothetical protein